MRRQARTLIIITAAVLVLTALLLSLLVLLPKKGDETSSQAETSSNTSVRVINKTTDASGKTVDKPVKKAVVNTGTEQFELSPDKEGQLVVKGFEDLPVGTSEIDTLISDLSNLTASRQVAANSEKAADYGLDQPKATVEVTYHDDSVVTFELGNEAAGDAGSYLRVKADGPIYLVESTFADQVKKSAVMYIGTSLITPPQPQSGASNDKAVMKEMKLSGAVRESKTVTVGVNNQKGNGYLSTYSYLITAPYLRGTNDQMTSLAESVPSLNALQAIKAHPTAAQLKEYGLDNPYSVCELTLAVSTTAASSADSSVSGTTVVSYYNEAKHTIKLGNKDASGNYYAVVDGYNVVYLIDASSVSWAETQYKDIVSPTLFLKDITTVKSISLEAGGKKTTFTLSHSPSEEDADKKLAVKSDGKTYPTDQFRTLYQVIMSMNRYGETDETPSGNPDVALSLIPLDAGDSSFSARFYKKTASLYTCVLTDGEVYTVKASDMDHLTAQRDNYLQGKPVTTS